MIEVTNWGRPLRTVSASGNRGSSFPDPNLMMLSGATPLVAMTLMEVFSTRPRATPSAPSMARLLGPVSVAVTSFTLTARDIALVVRSTMLVCRWRRFSRSSTKAEWVTSAEASRTTPMIRCARPLSLRRIRAWTCVHWCVPFARGTWKWTLYELWPPVMASSIASSSRSRSAGSSRDTRIPGSGVNSSGSSPKTSRPAASMSSDRVSRFHSKLPVRFRASRSSVPVSPLYGRSICRRGVSSESGSRSWSVIPAPEIVRRDWRTVRPVCVSCTCPIVEPVPEYCHSGPGAPTGPPNASQRVLGTPAAPACGPPPQNEHRKIVRDRRTVQPRG